MSAAKIDFTVAESIPLSDQNSNLKKNDPSPDQEGNIKSHESSPEREPKTATSQLDRKAWIIFSGLVVSALISALDGSIVSTALPTIAADLGLGGKFVWDLPAPKLPIEPPHFHIACWRPKAHF